MISIAFKTTVIVTFPHIPPSLLSDVIPVKVSADSYWMECLRGPQRAFMGEMGLTPRRSVKGEWAAVVERSRLRKRVFQVGEWETWSNKWSVQGVSSRWTTSIRCVVESGRKKKLFIGASFQGCWLVFTMRVGKSGLDTITKTIGILFFTIGWSNFTCLSFRSQMGGFDGPKNK